MLAVFVAVALVTTVSIDLGPSLKARAEAAASQFMGRPMHIGRLSIHLWLGRFVVEDVVIEGLTPQSRPFLMAQRINVSVPWSTLFDRRVVFDAIEMTDWRMFVETFPDGRHNFPRFTRERRAASLDHHCSMSAPAAESLRMPITALPGASSAATWT